MCRPGTRVIPLGGRTTCITSRPRSPVGAVRCGSRRRRARNSGRATPSLRHEPGVALSSWSTLHFHPVRRAASLDEDSFLCIHTKAPSLSSLPWTELISRPDVPPTRSGIVRVCNLTGSTRTAALATLPEILLAGWAELSVGSGMPGIQRELRQFKKKFSSERLKVRVLGDPPRTSFLRACQDSQAAIVHISPPSLIRDSSGLAIPVTADVNEPQPEAQPFGKVGLNVLVNTLKNNSQLGLMVVNSCSSGLVGCGSISRDLNVAALGWPAQVRDDTAADFTFYFYERLLEGLTPAKAIQSFAKAVWSRQALIEFPILWLPSPEWLAWSPLGEALTPSVQTDDSLRPKPPRARKAGSRAAEHNQDSATAPTISRPQNIQMEFRPRVAINPALLVNGLHPIAHLSIDSPEEQTVHLCITCDTGGGLSAYRQMVTLKRGTNPVPVEEIHFPALHELIDRHAHRRRVSFTATIVDLNKNELFGETRTAVWMSATEWLDQEATWAFVPAFVNPLSEGVLQVFGEATKVLRTLGTPSDAFRGYSSPVATQMRAIYQTIRDHGNGITYISPPGSPVFEGASKQPAGQVVRTHGEVLQHRLGTCHDLALLLGACAEYVGIRALIALLPGHTLFGYWTAANHQVDYWKTETKLRTGKDGEDWTITNRSKLLTLIDEQKVVMVEATCVCEKGKTFEEACAAGAEKLRSDGMDAAIDIYAARRRVQPV
ncbi:hypothetical protein ACVIYH_004855 [Bradyrhizobium diazoefficiens]